MWDSSPHCIYAGENSHGFVEIRIRSFFLIQINIFDGNRISQDEQSHQRIAGGKNVTCPVYYPNELGRRHRQHLRRPR